MYDYEIKPDDVCEICGKPASETELVWIAHGGALGCAGECDPRYNHPREREYAEVTSDILDELEFKADAWDAFIMGVEVKPDVLHTMIRELRWSKRADKKAMPTPCELLTARDWILSGCPAYPVKRFGDRLDPKEAIDILHRLTEALPSHMPQYCCGTPEHKEAMVKCQDEPKPKCWHEKDQE
jgi:hypothetical protein